jgi:A/G-specific adenine glycosylase
LIRVTESLAQRVIEWQKVFGRHDLPWQNTTDAYRIWLSEVMLQQTQVVTVVDYYQRFLRQFPTVADLAAASIDEVLALWSGLGYYSRARNLHRCAQVVVEQYGGQFPMSQTDLATLPGIGRSTAAAISAFAYGQSTAILDGNVKRVFCRVFGIEGYPGKAPIENQLWQIAEVEKPVGGVQAYTQGLMDLGATLCTRQKPVCEKCPLRTRCVAFQSNRQAELPTRKPKKAAVSKVANFELTRLDAKILLERRPPSGVWGGLWCLPQCQDVPKTSKAIASFEHSFTHFKMLAQIFQFPRASQSIASINDDSRRFVTLEQALALGLPAPIRIYLESLV